MQLSVKLPAFEGPLALLLHLINKNKVDIYYVAFSGGKDSVTTFDIVRRALPHNDFKVIFGDIFMSI